MGAPRMAGALSPLTRELGASRCLSGAAVREVDRNREKRAALCEGDRRAMHSVRASGPALRNSRVVT